MSSSRGMRSLPIIMGMWVRGELFMPGAGRKVKEGNNYGFARPSKWQGGKVGTQVQRFQRKSEVSSEGHPEGTWEDLALRQEIHTGTGVERLSSYLILTSRNNCRYVFCWSRKLDEIPVLD